MDRFGIQSLTMKGILLASLMLLLASVSILAQSDANEEKKKARISLDYFNKNNSEQTLVATVKTRIEGFYEAVQGAKINFYSGMPSEENFMASKLTDMHGIAEYVLPPLPDSVLVMTYVAALENNQWYSDADRETTVRKAVMEMTLETIDSVNTVTIFVGTPDSSGTVIPVEDVSVRIFVDRLFGMLPVAKEAEPTDAEGFMRIAFPSDIPGDDAGDITIVAQVSDHDDFGNMELTERIRWGIPIALNPKEQQKELWLSSANTSMAILIITNTLLLGVVAVVFYIIRQLVRISRLGIKQD